MNENDLATDLSPALEAAAVDDGWISPTILVTIPPRPPPPILKLDEEVGVVSIAVVVVATAEAQRLEL